MNRNSVVVDKIIFFLSVVVMIFLLALVLNAYNQATYTGFNLASTWTVYEGHTYPLLNSFLTPLTVTATAASNGCVPKRLLITAPARWV